MVNIRIWEETVEYQQFGRIKFIPGEKGGRFPFCNSLFIDDSVKAVVDPGAGREKLLELNRSRRVELLLNTHYHFDHISFNYVFSDSKIYLNETEGNCFRDIRDIARRLGMSEVFGEEWIDGWLGRIARADGPQSPYSPQNRHEWWLSTGRLDGTYRWEDVLDFGNVRMKVIGAPGHTEGFSCFHFPGEGVVYAGDYDLSEFGPFYGGSDSDIGMYIESARKIASLDAEIFITGHEAGVLLLDEFKRRLEKFLEIIDIRERDIARALEKPMNLEEISSLGLIYGKRYLVDDWVRAWELLMVKKHLERMIGEEMVSLANGYYERRR